MVKYGREEGMLRPFFSCMGLFEKQPRDTNSDNKNFVFLQYILMEEKRKKEWHKSKNTVQVK